MITDNTFTAEEITAAVTANPALIAAVRTGLSGQKIEVLTETEKNSFVESERGKIRNEESSAIYTRLDADILAATGVAKTHSEEKTYDYYKRTYGLTNTKVTEAADKIKDLETKIANGSADQTLKDQLEAAKLKLKDLEDVQIPQLKKDVDSKDIEREVALALTGIKLKSDLPEVLTKPAIDAVTKDLVSRAKKDAAGNVYFVDKDGKTELTGVANATAKDILSNQLKDIIDTGIQQEGGGSKPPAPGAPKPTDVKNKDGVIISIPATIKTKVELHDYLGEQGLVESDENFNKIYETYGEKLPTV